MSPSTSSNSGAISNVQNKKQSTKLNSKPYDGKLKKKEKEDTTMLRSHTLSQWWLASPLFSGGISTNNENGITKSQRIF